MTHIGFVFTHFGKWAVACNECWYGSNIKPITSTRLYRENVGDYRQTCHLCDKILVIGKTQAWCELYQFGAAAS